MPKPLALLFASISVILMSATAVALNHNLWLALLFMALTFGSIGAGFITRARIRRSRG